MRYVGESGSPKEPCWDVMAAMRECGNAWRLARIQRIALKTVMRPAGCSYLDCESSVRAVFRGARTAQEVATYVPCWDGEAS
jgi:hypothetical protein